MLTMGMTDNGVLKWLPLFFELVYENPSGNCSPCLLIISATKEMGRKYPSGRILGLVPNL